ncbi:hypothetical protein [Mesorhizobium shangrilense]|uniref:Uncharacterized protein n=1 Tax=Mesorhizobium shangrilense TaxID=460060 RepID=A0ABV2DM84_9HYPH
MRQTPVGEPVATAALTAADLGKPSIDRRAPQAISPKKFGLPEDFRTVTAARIWLARLS